MTPPLHVQTYLRSGKSLEDLKNDHGINYHVQNGKISLSYNQILVRDADELSQQCRGLILRDQSFDVVAVPMFRFFNIEQTTIASEIDWNTASIEEKLDGTLVIVYYDHVMGRWFTATRSRPAVDQKQTFRSIRIHLRSLIYLKWLCRNLAKLVKWIYSYS